MALLMGNRYKLKLDIGDPVDVSSLDAASHPITVLTGIDEFEFTPEQIETLKKYFREGA